MIPSSSVYDAGDCRFMLFDKDDIVSDALKNKVGHDPHIVQIASLFLDKYLENEESGVVLDVGANVGSFCVPLGKNYPQFKFHAFEPQRIVFYQLCSNILLNRCDNVYANNYGLSFEPDSFYIEMPDYSTELNIGAFSLDDEVRENGYECSSSGETELISVIKLDNIEINDIKLIKIDVEGLELAVLIGAQKTLERNGFPPILFEAWANKEWFQPRRQELFEYIESIGYEIANIGQDNIAQHSSNKVLEIRIQENNDCVPNSNPEL
jgi:FkbM family methyltransferase